MPLETTPFDATVYIKTPERQAEYLFAALEDGDPSVIALVLGDIARARRRQRIRQGNGPKPGNHMQDARRRREPDA